MIEKKNVQEINEYEREMKGQGTDKHTKAKTKTQKKSKFNRKCYLLNTFIVAYVAVLFIAVCAIPISSIYLINRTAINKW